MVEPAPIVQCGNLDCKVGQDGKCVEGLTLDKCPHYGKTPQPKSVIGIAADETHGVLLPSGDLLTVEEASGILRRGESRVIAIVGPKEVGKTTLIASIFELLLRGSVGPYRFSSSRTLYAFERSCHPSRAISQNVVPKTERTLLTDVHFYHLATRRDGSPLVDMLLADRNGEDYRASTDDPSTASDFAEIARADTISFLVDGDQLGDLTTRSSVVSEVLATAQALIDGEVLVGRPRVAIILTKVDQIKKLVDPERSMRDFRKLVARFGSLYSEAFGEIRSFEVAACPADTSLSLGYGIPELLNFWQMKSPEPVIATEPYVSRSTRFMHLLHGTQE
ncbi:TRAFAC clade GTPase domain-containing protein [Tardiphaga sp. 285_C5_N1_2]|uniref:TRAFAC clade GTPase domain-containing protein n=1 Tax=Tardiphaga sp. 285_C5_N1_2 TaxID=3240775 RepID=UPI003F896E79